MPSTAEKLRARLSETEAGWSDRDLWKILTAWGFLSREGNHTVYQHKEHTDLTIVIPHGRDLKKVYAREVKKLLDELDRRSKGGPNT